MSYPTSEVQPATLSENKLTINLFLKNSYGQAKEQIENGVLFIKNEFSFFYHETGEYLTKMSLPVNNFLKDLAQIESELLQEVSKDSSQFLLMNGEMVPVEKVLTMQMEENH